ncbi:DUF5133 domain-containing protein [Streptomyces sp. NPDC060027]|uniref:DUF5133 domain-containing protein n=1 Tax=Streptomyces sp. NPDC060027 TaxID=3347040 RepID=UPI0036833A12
MRDLAYTLCVSTGTREIADALDRPLLPGQGCRRTRLQLRSGHEARTRTPSGRRVSQAPSHYSGRLPPPLRRIVRDAPRRHPAPRAAAHVVACRQRGTGQRKVRCGT